MSTAVNPFSVGCRIVDNKYIYQSNCCLILSQFKIEDGTQICYSSRIAYCYRLVCDEKIQSNLKLR